jgi:hypothetical protein
MGAASHSALAGGRWHTLTLVEQLAHVGSEVERALRASEQGRSDRLDHALSRALELFDLTAADERWRGPRRRETLRVREHFCGLFFADTPIPGSDGADYLRRYFLQFAVAARLARR